MVTPMQLEIRQYVKAVVGGLIAALSLLGGALGNGLSNEEIIGLVVAFLTGFVAVFYAPNRAAKGSYADPDLSEQDPLRDGGSVVVALLAGIGLLFLLLIFVPGMFR